MLHFFLFLLLIFIAIVVIGLSVVGSILRAIFGFGRRRPATSSSGGYTRASSNQQSYTQEEASSSSTRTSQGKASAHKKIFTKDEGEYVDFEEIKN